MITPAMTFSGLVEKPGTESIVSRGLVWRLDSWSAKTLETTSFDNALGGSEGKISMKTPWRITTRFTM